MNEQNVMRIEEVEEMIKEKEKSYERRIDELGAEVKRLQNTSSNSDYVKCGEEIASYIPSDSIISKGKIIEILRKHFA